MNSILWALIALVGLGSLIALGSWIARRGQDSTEEDELASTPIAQGGCCGMHQTCERDSLLAAVSTSIVYYDDEELDRYRGVDPEAYSPESVEEFRDILISLRPDDVAGWMRSLQHRDIDLPEELKPELYLIVQENRAYHMEHGPDDTLSHAS